MSRCGTVFKDGSRCGDGKADHVRREMRRGPTPGHHCHWPGGCKVITAAAQYCCTAHWRRIPRYLQRQIWAAYRIGQETDKTPTRRYIEVVRAVEAWYQEEFLGL